MGVGSGVQRRVMRAADFRLAADVPELRPFLTSVREEVGGAVELGQQVVIEGTQGFGLSLYHTEEWPFATSRDTTAFTFVGEVGVGVRDLQVIVAVRTFPIRVAGNSGPLANELTWEEVRVRSGYPHDITERTTTTKRIRRVAAFDWDIVLRAVRANAPVALALHGADYIDYANKGVTKFADLTEQARAFVTELEARTGVPVAFIGTGPNQAEVIDRCVGLQHATASTSSRLH